MSFSPTTREIFQENLKEVVAKVDAATTLKDLTHAICTEASLRSALNAEVVPNLLYSCISCAVDHLMQRLTQLGWQQAVPPEQLGLKLIDCAHLADLLHLLHLPLRTGSVDIPEADQRIALKAAKRLEAALSNLSSEKLQTLATECAALSEQRENAEAEELNQKFVIVWTASDHQAIMVTRCFKHQFATLPRASREHFDTHEAAASYATALAARHMLALVTPNDPEFLD